MDKRHILEEIKRTARANGGKPLGKERFYQETGIRESDWTGKHWARWGDALRESGFEPNRMQGAHDEKDVIEKFIGLMRELGKFPTANEVKLKARSTPGFPWHSTFARFGSKHEFAARIREYARNARVMMTLWSCARSQELLRLRLVTMLNPWRTSVLFI